MDLLEHAKAIIKEYENTVVLKETENNRNYRIYIHYLEENNKGYIGQTMQAPKQRWKNGKKYEHNLYFSNAIKKYGWKKFKHIILIKNIDLDTANYLETLLIETLKTNNRKYGYNIASGGGNKNHSKETIEKITAHWNSYSPPEDIGDRISKGLKEYYKNNPRTYKKLTKEHKNNISKGVKKYYEDDKKRERQSKIIKDSYKNNPERLKNLSRAMQGINKGKTHSEETKEKIRKKAIGRKGPQHSKETIARLREINLGVNNPMYGMTGTKNPNSKEIYGINKKDNSRIEFKTVKDAANFFNLKNHTSISNCLNGRSKSSCGYYWYYK